VARALVGISTQNCGNTTQNLSHIGNMANT